MVGIIDIGSNTIRLVAYDKKRRVFNNGLSSEIINDTKNGILSEDGIEKLVLAVSFLKEKAGEIPTFAFGTYAMRVLINKEEVKNRVFEKTGIMIDILSGEDEARYDFYGLLGSISSKESGIGVDLGGGSAQILIFEEGELKTSNSLPLGCRQIKNKFTDSKTVTPNQRARIASYIKFNLASFAGNKAEKIYIMGGTAKAALKIYSFLTGENQNAIKTKNLEDVIKFLSETPASTLKNILRNRYDNITVGIIIMEEIAKFFSAERICIKKCGVRDGYIYKNFSE